MPENSLFHMLPLLVLSWLQCVQGWQDGQSDLLAQNVQTHSKQIWAGASLLLGALTVPLVTHSIRRLAKPHPRTEVVDVDRTEESMTGRPSDFLQPEEPDTDLRKRTKSAKKKVKREEKKKQATEVIGQVVDVEVPLPVVEVLAPAESTKTIDVVTAPKNPETPAVSVPTVASKRVDTAVGAARLRVEKKKQGSTVKKATVSVPAPVVPVTTQTRQVARPVAKSTSWAGASPNVWAQPEPRRHTQPETAHFSFFTDGGFCGALIGAQNESSKISEVAQPENHGTYSLFGTPGIF